MIAFEWVLFLLIIGHIFLFVCMPGNFLLDVRHHEFYFFEYWKFELPTNILMLSSQSVPSYLEIVWFFQALLWRLGESSVVLRLELIIFYHWGKNLLCTLPSAPGIINFCSPIGRNKHYSLYYVSAAEYCFFQSFLSGFFPQSYVILSHACTDQ